MATCGNRTPDSCPPNFSQRYTVQDNDTMYTISRQFGVSLDALIAANPQISDPSVICPGDVLCVPSGGSACGTRQPSSCPVGFSQRYTVQDNDTMYTIARQFGVSLDALIAANPQISNPNVICPGDVVCVPGNQPLTLPCSIVLSPTSVVTPESPYAKGASLYYTGARPQLLRPGVWAVVATLLPDPSTFGNWDEYQAVLYEVGGEQLAYELDLHQTPDGAWAGQMVDVISATIDETFRVQVRLANTTTGATGPTVLRGTLADCASS